MLIFAQGTSEVEIFPITHPSGRRVFLVDTPGFDDTNKTDTEVLTSLASHVSQMYKDRVELSGIVYLHRITDVRFNGSAVKNLRMFRKLCGERFYPRVVLATTMWENLRGPDISQETGINREGELTSNNDWWGLMIKKGSKIFRHTDNEGSAWEIIDHILGIGGHDSLAIQREIVEENKTLAETSAGKEVNKELESATEKWKEDLENLKEEHELALQERDEEVAIEVEKEMQKQRQHIEQAMNDKVALVKMGFDQLIEENERRYKSRVAELDERERRNRERLAEERRQDREEQARRERVKDEQIAEIQRQNEARMKQRDQYFEKEREREKAEQMQRREEERRERRELEKQFKAQHEQNREQQEQERAYFKQQRALDKQQHHELTTALRRSETERKEASERERSQREADVLRWQQNMDDQSRRMQDRFDSTVSDLRSQIETLSRAGSPPPSLPSTTPYDYDTPTLPPSSPALSWASGASGASRVTNNYYCNLM